MSQARKIDRIGGRESSERTLDESGRTVPPSPRTGWRPLPEHDAEETRAQAQNPLATGERVGDTAQHDKTHDRHGGKLDHDGKLAKEPPGTRSR